MRRLLLVSAIVMLIGVPQVVSAGTPIVSNGLIAYRASAGISTRQADGTHHSVLIRTGDFTGVFDPAWSPDGAMLAYARYGGGSSLYSLRILHLDGSGKRVIYRGARSSATLDEPDWSPDGTSIAFHTHNYNTGVGRIMVVGVDGADPHRVGPRYVRTPTWSSDGSRIAFTRHPGLGVDTGDIWVMDADGTNRIALTSDGLSFSPSWSSDGSRIAFIGLLGDEQNDLYVMDADGSNVVRLTNTGRLEFAPAWAPTGSRIVFERRVGSTIDLFTIEPDGSGLTRLTQTPNVDEVAPDWQPVIT